jgi:hypothetical protein
MIIIIINAILWLYIGLIRELRIILAISLAYISSSKINPRHVYRPGFFNLSQTQDQINIRLSICGPQDCNLKQIIKASCRAIKMLLTYYFK